MQPRPLLGDSDPDHAWHFSPGIHAAQPRTGVNSQGKSFAAIRHQAAAIRRIHTPAYGEHSTVEGGSPRAYGEHGTGGRRPHPRRTDHPRAYGEHLCCEVLPQGNIGSPPRVRGARVRLPDLHRERRITPACAGRTCATTSTPSCTTDHPRVCGGGRRDHHRDRGGHRITPARTGSTTRSRRRRTRRADHPRTYGEHAQRPAVHTDYLNRMR